MAMITWKTIDQRVCDRIGEAVCLEARLVYAAEVLPDQPPRVLAHRCSNGVVCNQMEQPACVWAGTNPGYDPFSA